MWNAEWGMPNVTVSVEERTTLPFHSAFRIPHSCHQDRHDLVRLRHEPDGFPPSLEHQRRGLALVGPHAVGALDALPEPPRARRLAAGRVVAAQHERRALLRGLYRRDHEPGPLERNVDGRGRQLRRVAQPEATHREKHVLPQRRDDIAALDLGLGYGGERELYAARAEALRQRRGGGATRRPRARRPIPPRQPPPRAPPRHHQVPPPPPPLPEEPRREP